jgi:hypothetical protein
MPLMVEDVGQHWDHAWAVQRDLLERPAAVAWASVGKLPITELPAGGTGQYPLRRGLLGEFYPADQGLEFVVDELPGVVGHGLSHEDTLQDWRDQVHVSVQQLLDKRPFELDANERERLSRIESVIDLAAYQRTTPLSVRQIGWVLFLRSSRPQAIRWLNGTMDRVPLDKAPGLFAGLRPYQWIDAVTQRDPVTGQLLRIAYLQPIKAPRQLTQAEQSEFVRELPHAVAPESDLDWTSLD